MIVTTREHVEYAVTMDAAEYEQFRRWVKGEKEMLETIKNVPQYVGDYKMLEQLNHELTFPRQR